MSAEKTAILASVTLIQEKANLIGTSSGPTGVEAKLNAYTESLRNLITKLDTMLQGGGIPRSLYDDIMSYISPIYFELSGQGSATSPITDSEVSALASDVIFDEAATIVTNVNIIEP